MESAVHLYMIIFLSSIWTASSTVCSIKDRIECTYTVVCEGHAGSANNPNCDFEPYVIFVIKNSTAETLTTGFFGATNFDSRVRHLLAVNNSWLNIESFAFKYYTKCREMDLSNNNIKNIKNDAFKNLFVLDILNLSHNAIERLNPGSLVISENSANQLTTLDLSYNLLTDISSEAFSKIIDLKRLDLQNNKLKTLADDCFSPLKNLVTLNLQNNQLTSINVTLIHLKNLKTLNLQFNHLLKVIGFELNRLESLINLNMSYNGIEEIESNSFNQAFNLVSIDLSNNRIKSSLDNVLLINNYHLQYLDLSNNSIEHIQDDVFKHNAMVTLNLDKNNIKGDITSKTYNGIANVTKLSLFNQSITAIRKDAFATATSLVYLNLSKNHIYKIEPSSFPHYSILKVLDISYNNLSDVDFLNNSIVSLTDLLLNNNKLSYIKQGTFLNQINLKKLDLSMNFITTIEKFSLPLLNLQYFNITGNLLKGILESNIISPSKYLRFLDFSRFRFDIVSDGAFVDSPLVARVNLSHNAIKFIGSENFKNMDNLYSLDLSYNRLHSIAFDNSTLLNLKSLYLNNNLLYNISMSFLNISNLLYLDISHNNINEISDPMLQTLKNLRVLHVSSNKLAQFNNKYTNCLNKLMTLSLSSNLLSNLNLSYFPDLINVDLSNNNITFINSSFFQNLDYLQSIDLSYNNITSLTPGTFQKLKILKLLNLSSNSISNLRYGSFRGLGRAEVIDVSRNGIHDLDAHIFHECKELTHLIIDYNFITQLDFESLVMTATKLNVLSLGGNPIKCKEIVKNYMSGVGGRRVEVTSIDKLFEEDNVHGIWCGKGTIPTSTVGPLVEPQGAQSATSILLAWCTILTIVILAVAGAGYMYRQKGMMIFRDSASMRSTVRFGSADIQGNLLL